MTDKDLDVINPGISLPKVGESYKYVIKHKRYSNSPKLTIGREYMILECRKNYRFKKNAVAIRNDEGELRWYSSNGVLKHFRLRG